MLRSIYKYTVLENRRGGRFCTSFSTDFKKEWYMFVKHCETLDEAQKLCEQKHIENNREFFDNFKRKKYAE